MRKTKPLSDRFWEKVLKTDACWLWTGAKDTKGYGKISVTLEPKKYKWKQSHRVSYELHYGSIPRGLLILHSCDNPSCVNPKHLRTGTHKDNTQDMISKGRKGKVEKQNITQEERERRRRLMIERNPMNNPEIREKHLINTRVGTQKYHQRKQGV